ncbi:MerR family transcriptional regulator [Planktotalea sp.]|uniref:MerR family transcriptional regulator n=1 Tax=Planktotalea sp. TaxID=2029877 RepID=UPI003299CC68
MKIAEVSERVSLSIYTIRYYEKAGLLPKIERGSDGHRRFSQNDLDWLVLLASLRETGMPMKQMKHFAALYQLGDATVRERRGILSEHQVILEETEARLQKCKTLLSYKIGRYDQILGANECA